jgi:hypothetical protein
VVDAVESESSEVDTGTAWAVVVCPFVGVSDRAVVEETVLADEEGTGADEGSVAGPPPDTVVVGLPAGIDVVVPTAELTL